MTLKVTDNKYGRLFYRHLRFLFQSSHHQHRLGDDLHASATNIRLSISLHLKQ